MKNIAQIVLQYDFFFSRNLKLNGNTLFISKVTFNLYPMILRNQPKSKTTFSQRIQTINACNVTVIVHTSSLLVELAHFPKIHIVKLCYFDKNNNDPALFICDRIGELISETVLTLSKKPHLFFYNFMSSI